MTRNGHKRYDKDLVKDAARGRWDSIILAECPSLSSDHVGGNHGPCPKCGGNDRFRVFENFKELRNAIGSTVIVKPSLCEPGQSARMVAVRRTMTIIDMSGHNAVTCPLALISIPATSKVDTGGAGK